MRIRKENDMNEEELYLTSQVSDALAHPVRLKIFRYIYLQNKELKKVCNKDLVENFNYAQATISQHCQKLSQSGLIDVKKEERYSYYYVNVGVLMRFVNAVKKFEY